jgi:hypothetical protein
MGAEVAIRMKITALIDNSLRELPLLLPLFPQRYCHPERQRGISDLSTIFIFSYFVAKGVGESLFHTGQTIRRV